MEDDSQLSVWALLIGINFYPGDDATKPLAGCVRDVEQLQQRLDGHKDIHTWVLRGSAEHGDSKSLSKMRPADDEQYWPTLDNVRSRISTILSKANPGDMVFIHFSGHGVRRKTRSEDFGDHENGDLALVLYDPVSGVRYLQGLELAVMLKQMVDGKGLKPVLVLDCCHSGAVLRHGLLDDQDHNPQQGAIREAVYDPEIDRQSSYPSLPREELPNFFKALYQRDASPEISSFLDPATYAILTACGPNEVSHELTLLDGSKSGPLSYFLLFGLTAIRRNNIPITLKSIHDYISVHFHAGLVKQTPRRFGNEKMVLFSRWEEGNDLLETRVWWEKESSQLVLEAGQMHGVAENDRYHLQGPWSKNDKSRESIDEAIILQVSRVYALTATLEAIDKETDLSMVKTAWIATPCTHLSQRRLHVRLSPQLHRLDRWQQIIAKSPFLTSSTKLQGNEALPLPLTSLFIDVKDEREYLILDERKRAIANLPSIPITRSSADIVVVEMLDHVAKFKYIERLENRLPNVNFERSIRVQLVHSATGRAVDDMGGVLEVADGDKVLLRCANFSDKPAYFGVFNLTPTWRIKNLLMEKHGDSMDLQPLGGREKSTNPTYTLECVKPLKIRMTVPKELKAEGRSEDVLKIFITQRRVSLSSLCLAAIKSTNNRQFSEQGTVDAMIDLLEVLEHSSPTTRGVTRDGGVDDNWLVRNFVIRVSRRQDSK